ncbi:uncharacterized protein BJ171DRAFT_609725 [Polychytrium aggregatum]|uniref:uncharacterized protein n=1 Tax=Polychytrium aggregatum TaxID=110093 RepID=UPI0022FE411E|nr:uncharacterized protein BJ171DRAFT_609725 [Polychytrium aggregatum]KAI9206623.1 hypothetical protein BJ171DRAFT_609725 [Polychytrium aggregatum]
MPASACKVLHAVLACALSCVGQGHKMQSRSSRRHGQRQRPACKEYGCADRATLLHMSVNASAELPFSRALMSTPPVRTGYAGMCCYPTHQECPVSPGFLPVVMNRDSRFESRSQQPSPAPSAIRSSLMPSRLPLPDADAWTDITSSAGGYFNEDHADSVHGASDIHNDIDLHHGHDRDSDNTDDDDVDEDGLAINDYRGLCHVQDRRPATRTSRLGSGNGRQAEEHIARALEPQTHTHQDPTLQQQLGPAEKAENDALAEKIRQGLSKIKHLDEILKQKTLLAKSLSVSSRNSATPAQTVDDDGCVDDCEDTESLYSDGSSLQDKLETGSVQSRDIKTFITNAKLTRIPGKIRTVENGAANHEHPEQNLSAAKAPLPKGYRPGDFIQRNIVLGPEARYYCAMTEEERARVESILDNHEDDDDFPDDASSAPSTSHAAALATPTRPATTLSSGFAPLPKDRDKLIEIDHRLSELIPSIQWDLKSIIWSRAPTSGYMTPDASVSATVSDVSEITAPSPGFRVETSCGHSSVISIRDVDEVMNDVSIYKIDKISSERDVERIQKIDSDIEALKTHEPRPITQEELYSFIAECVASDQTCFEQSPTRRWVYEHAQTATSAPTRGVSRGEEIGTVTS